jgi:hypothetical protein
MVDGRNSNHRCATVAKIELSFALHLFLPGRKYDHPAFARSEIGRMQFNNATPIGSCGAFQSGVIPLV